MRPRLATGVPFRGGPYEVGREHDVLESYGASTGGDHRPRRALCIGPSAGPLSVFTTVTVPFRQIRWPATPRLSVDASQRRPMLSAWSSSTPSPSAPTAAAHPASGSTWASESASGSEPESGWKCRRSRSHRGARCALPSLSSAGSSAGSASLIAGELELRLTMYAPGCATRTRSLSCQSTSSRRCRGTASRSCSPRVRCSRPSASRYCRHRADSIRTPPTRRRSPTAARPRSAATRGRGSRPRPRG